MKCPKRSIILRKRRQMGTLPLFAPNSLAFLPGRLRAWETSEMPAMRGDRIPTRVTRLKVVRLIARFNFVGGGFPQAAASQCEMHAVSLGGIRCRTAMLATDLNAPEQQRHG